MTTLLLFNCWLRIENQMVQGRELLKVPRHVAGRQVAKQRLLIPTKSSDQIMITVE